jgi:hypothetical protein
MNQGILDRSGKIQTYIMAVIIFAITLLANFSREVFVADSGKFEIFGNLGFLLVVGLIFRWRYIRQLVSILAMLVIFAILMSVVMLKGISMSFFILLLGFSAVFYLSTFSEEVKAYLDRANISR